MVLQLLPPIGGCSDCILQITTRHAHHAILKSASWYHTHSASFTQRACTNLKQPARQHLPPLVVLFSTGLPQRCKVEWMNTVAIGRVFSMSHSGLALQVLLSASREAVEAKTAPTGVFAGSGGALIRSEVSFGYR